MDYDEQMHLFGAPPGQCVCASVSLERPQIDGCWVVRLRVETVMRAKPWVINVHSADGTTLHKPMELMYDIVEKSIYCRSETVRLHMIRLFHILARDGEDVDVKFEGKDSISV